MQGWIGSVSNVEMIPVYRPSTGIAVATQAHDEGGDLGGARSHWSDGPSGSDAGARSGAGARSSACVIARGGGPWRREDARRPLQKPSHSVGVHRGPAEVGVATSLSPDVAPARGAAKQRAHRRAARQGLD